MRTFIKVLNNVLIYPNITYIVSNTQGLFGLKRLKFLKWRIQLPQKVHVTSNISLKITQTDIYYFS